MNKSRTIAMVIVLVMGTVTLSGCNPFTLAQILGKGVTITGNFTCTVTPIC